MKKAAPLIMAFIFGAIFAAGAFYWSLEAGSAQAASSAQTIAASAAKADQRSIFKVDSISCYSCEARIKRALLGVQGVANVEVNIQDKTVAVDYQKSVTDEKKIADVITKAGYPAVFVSHAAPGEVKKSEASPRGRFGCGPCCDG